MPKNKEALIRYRVINRCLRDRTYATKDELKRACERALDISPIGERTIDGDIHAMRNDDRLGYHAPIRMDRNRGAYYYDDPDYSIDNIPLNEDDMRSIQFAASLLEQYKGIELFSRFAGSVQKLFDVVRIYRHIPGEDKRNFIEFEQAVVAKGTEYIDELIRAIKDKKVMTVTYKSFTSERSTSNIIHPYHLKEYRNRWYLIGYNEKYKEIRTYGLDRFTKLETENSGTFIDIGFDTLEHYKHVIGISALKKDPVEIRIAFTEEQAQYVITQPLHHTQKALPKDGDRFVFSYHIVPNFEFYAMVLGWGDEVEVLSPQEIRVEMLKISSKIAANYK